ncbi:MULTISPECIES: GNAT family N-acetyltransferase [Aequorivita]|uniref:GNAT family N-acetyltransferase n=1 Tax=Aequorivita iocasae TaxID=2803865 RepID=A0ABX7DVK2_9FLAO|nr:MULTISPECIES: GNAT family N-acetyltransferase [Aequorivita]QQX77636.1 GNAT family N-acetyltransferase [Aequorivita iocasae]UCA57133.1 GNAT family N-acetyltransferase [Aequorivita sp. F7]
MEIEVKNFGELTTKQLYGILQLRSEVFVVEQDCVYQDIDGKDERALHIMGWEDGNLVAYARCFQAGDYFDEASIGRVLVRENYRKMGYGHAITKAAIEAIKTNYKADKIKISAQVYLVIFYESHGFKTYGDRYMEDGIPHIAMIRA